MAELMNPGDSKPVVPQMGGGRDLHETAHALTRHIEEGKHAVPNEPAPLVCKPTQLESWRVFKIMSEFVEGFELLGKYGLAATFFGSVRTTPDNPYYQAADALAAKLAKAGYAIITGGSAGIMQAANEGAHDAGGSSVGLNIRLADNQGANKFLTDYMMFDHFFVRKVMLTFASEVYIYFPGGFGTMDEFFEIVTLIQTQKIKRIPVVVYGKAYWEPIIALLRTQFLETFHTVDEADLEIFHLVDTVDEAYDYIVKTVRC